MQISTGLRDRHLDELAHIAAAELERLSRFLVHPIPPDVASRRKWLKHHVIPDATHYVNAIGRTVRQIRSEARLREMIEEFLDRAKPPTHDREALRRQIQDFVRNEPSLQWALKPVQDRGWRLRRTIARIAIVLVAIPVLIIALPLSIMWAFVIRWHEKIECGDPPRSEPAHVATLADDEDRTLQNQFSALSFRKGTWIRLATPVVFLWLARIVVRYFFDTDNLAGLKTIHFARWTFIDGKRRLLFTSNYDGSHENYMGDFIDIVAWGLNASFSHGPEYPRTRWLILDGAWNERSFQASQPQQTNSDAGLVRGLSESYLRSTSRRTPGSVRGCLRLKTINRRLIGCDSCGATGEGRGRNRSCSRGKICRACWCAATRIIRRHVTSCSPLRMAKMEAPPQSAGCARSWRTPRL